VASGIVRSFGFLAEAFFLEALLRLEPELVYSAFRPTSFLPKLVGAGSYVL
jgi:hypothetical protein